MLKRLIGIAAVLMLLTSSVYGAEAPEQTVGLYICTGSLYYFDTPTGRLVLKNIRPAAPSAEAEAAAANAEYVELPSAAEGRFFADGNRAAAEWINEYADRELWFVLAVGENGGLSVPYFIIRV